MQQKYTRGFTLIETVISLTLLSFITMIGYQGLAFGMQQWRSGHDKMQFQYDHYQAISWIRNKLGSTEKVVSLNTNRSVFLFGGTEGSVEFVALYDQARRGGLYVNKLFYDTSEKSIRLAYYLHHPDVDPGFDNDSSEQVILLTGVNSVRLSYYGRKTGDSAARWHSDWQNANTLPQILNLDIETTEGINHKSTITILTSNNA